MSYFSRLVALSVISILSLQSHLLPALFKDKETLIFWSIFPLQWTTNPARGMFECIYTHEEEAVVGDGDDDDDYDGDDDEDNDDDGDDDDGV